MTPGDDPPAAAPPPDPPAPDPPPPPADAPTAPDAAADPVVQLTAQAVELERLLAAERAARAAVERNATADLLLAAQEATRLRAQVAAAERDRDQIRLATPRWLSIALGELPVSEVRGEGDNPRIVEYHGSTRLPPTLQLQDETAWCASFVGWCMAKAGHVPTSSAAARSWLKWGVGLDLPRLGAVTVLARGQPWQGHVAFWLAGDDSHCWLLGGNQADRVSVAAFPRSLILAWRWPAGDLPTAVPA